MNLVRNREVRVRIKIKGPTDGAIRDFERELKRKIQRAVHNRAMAQRHGVVVDAPYMPWGSSRDGHFVVDLRFVSAFGDAPDE